MVGKNTNDSIVFVDRSSASAVVYVVIIWNVSSVTRFKRPCRSNNSKFFMQSLLSPFYVQNMEFWDAIFRPN